MRPGEPLVPLERAGMDYRYDVFISYVHQNEWPRWVRTHFVPLLTHWLDEERGTPSTIFADFDVEARDSWPEVLQAALARSRILIPLLSRRYFTSRRCRSELARMLAREAFVAKGSTLRRPLILPAVIHGNAHDFPLLNQVQALDLRPFSNVFMQRESLSFERLSETIRDWVPQVASAIEHAAPYDETWVTLDAARFLDGIPVPDPPSLPRVVL